MKLRLALSIVALCLAYSSVRAETAADFTYIPPFRNSSLNGQMFENDAEFLTPTGIVDDIPIAALESITPAAGPEEAISSTLP